MRRVFAQQGFDIRRRDSRGRGGVRYRVSEEIASPVLALCRRSPSNFLFLPPPPLFFQGNNSPPRRSGGREEIIQLGAPSPPPLASSSHGKYMEGSRRKNEMAANNPLPSLHPSSLLPLPWLPRLLRLRHAMGFGKGGRKEGHCMEWNGRGGGRRAETVRSSYATRYLTSAKHWEMIVSCRHYWSNNSLKGGKENGRNSFDVDRLANFPPAASHCPLLPLPPSPILFLRRSLPRMKQWRKRTEGSGVPFIPGRKSL